MAGGKAAFAATVDEIGEHPRADSAPRTSCIAKRVGSAGDDSTGSAVCESFSTRHGTRAFPGFSKPDPTILTPPSTPPPLHVANVSSHGIHLVTEEDGRGSRGALTDPTRPQP